MAERVVVTAVSGLLCLLLVWFVRRRHGSIARSAPMRVTRRYVVGETCRKWKVSHRPLFCGALGSSDYTATYDRMVLL